MGRLLGGGYRVYAYTIVKREIPHFHTSTVTRAGYIQADSPGHISMANSAGFCFFPWRSCGMVEEELQEQYIHMTHATRESRPEMQSRSATTIGPTVTM